MDVRYDAFEKRIFVALQVRLELAETIAAVVRGDLDTVSFVIHIVIESNLYGLLAMSTDLSDKGSVPEESVPWRMAAN